MIVGWIPLVALGLGTVAATLALGLPRRVLLLLVSAVVLAGAGYAMQGRPGLSARISRPPTDRKPIVDHGPAELEHAMWCHGGGAWPDCRRTGAGRARADGRPLGKLVVLARSGAADARDWSDLAGELVRRDHGRISPVARIAFGEARRLAPRSPAPPFMLGLASVRAGELEAARPLWRDAIALTPMDAPFRRELALRLYALELVLGRREQP